MVPAGREGGIAQQRQAAMTPEQAQQQHEQAWRGMQQSVSRVAAKHNLSAETTTELATALESYMNSQKSLWDSVASGEMSQEEAMAQSEKNREDITGTDPGSAGQDVADEMGGMLGGGAPGDAQGGMGAPPQQGGQPPGGGGMTPTRRRRRRDDCPTRRWGDGAASGGGEWAVLRQGGP